MAAQLGCLTAKVTLNCLLVPYMVPWLITLKKKLFEFVAITGPADGLAPLGARSSACSVMTEFGSCKYKRVLQSVCLNQNIVFYVVVCVLGLNLIFLAKQWLKFVLLTSEAKYSSAWCAIDFISLTKLIMKIILLTVISIESGDQHHCIFQMKYPRPLAKKKWQHVMFL